MTDIVVIKLTPENRGDVARAALSMYLGECCKYCGKVAETMEYLETVVYAGEHEHGKIACQKCWDEHNPTDTKENK